MAYPPNSLPTNATDGTSASDTTPTAVLTAAEVNATNAAVNDIVAELGPNPSGVSATVGARLDGIEADVDALGSGSIPDGSVSTAKLADGAVTAAKVASDVATQAELDAETAARTAAIAGLSGTYAPIVHGHAQSDVTGLTTALAEKADNAATAAALAAKAPLTSPTFTGTPSGPTAAQGTSTTQLATTAFVQAATGAALYSASVTGATTVNAADGAVQTLTLTGNATFTLSSVSAGAAVTLTLILKQDATGGRTVTWPGSVDWGGGAAPTLSTAGDADDIVTLFTVDGGTKWFGFSQPSATTSAPSFYGVVASALPQNIGSAAVSTIGFNGTDVIDEATEWHTGSPNSRLTVPAGRAGKIRFSWSIGFGPNATGDRQIRIRKNGTTEFYTQTSKAASLATIVNGQTMVFDALVGDYYELRVYQDSGTSINVDGTFGAEWRGA